MLNNATIIYGFVNRFFCNFSLWIIRLASLDSEGGDPLIEDCVD